LVTDSLIRRQHMADESLSATTIIHAPAEVIFAVVADPTKHAAIDGTGWVREPLDSKPLTAAGQVFRMAMYHPNHPDGDYRVANRVRVFDPPNAISWEPGQDTDDGNLTFGGWVWRYDLTPAGPDLIDGTGWVREPLDSKPLTAAGQVFRMAMYHPNHPDGDYRVANRVRVFDPPNAISWEPGQDTDDGNLTFGGWVWRYDLTPAG